MDLGIIIAIVGSAIAITGVIVAMMFWVRTEANSLRSEAKEDRKDLVQLVYAIREETTKLITAIQLEMRDFHHKLYEIEKNKR